MATYNTLIMGASYGSLLGTKLLLAGHNVHLICLPDEAALDEMEERLSLYQELRRKYRREVPDLLALAAQLGVAERPEEGARCEGAPGSSLEGCEHGAAPMDPFSVRRSAGDVKPELESP